MEIMTHSPESSEQTCMRRQSHTGFDENGFVIFISQKTVKNKTMGPPRFERGSEDPQPPRMVQATLWPLA